MQVCAAGARVRLSCSAAMDLLNATKMQAGYTMGTEPSAREHLVVAVKGTFAIPDDGGPATPAEGQAPLVMADEFWGEPGFSSPRYEVDFALRKPKCDVLLNATCYAPHKLVRPG